MPSTVQLVTERRCALRATWLGLLIAASPLTRPASAQSIVNQYRDVATRIATRAQSDSDAWNRLADMTETFGNRLSGSASLERALDWALATMKKDGLDNVHGEAAMVPHWVRGAESAEMIEPRRLALPMLGLGGSIATPAGGVTGEVMVVRSFDDLHARAQQAKGKIVLFNVPFTSYGETVQYRTNGAIEASKAGAIASLIRSVTPYSQRTPHTGAMRYDPNVPKIAHAAITTEDADMIERMIARGQRVVVRLTMSAQTLPDAPSKNVMGEIRGSSLPDEVIVLSGHMDSWDVGRGAMDDGGGFMSALEALRVLKSLGLRPKRTIRVVGWTNEENGARGGQAYRDAHAGDLDKHDVVIESDDGAFKPQGFGFSGSDSAFAIVSQIGRLLDGIGAGSITKGGGGTDIEPMMQKGVPGMGLQTDGTRYFWYHHSEADTIDKLDPHEMQLCAAAMAIMAYVIADLPGPLPRASATR